jgi:5-formyltetrahydrofolate cyclo-ligase
MPEYQNARSIAIFMSMPCAEMDTKDLLKYSLSSGKRVFVPYIYKPKEPRPHHLPASIMDMLQLWSEEDYASLQPDKWGIPSITEETVPARTNAFGGKGVTNGEPPAPEAPGLDVILMPCMAFDKDLNRLGHGKGYYDNFITRYCLGKTLDGQKRKKAFLGMYFDSSFGASQSDHNNTLVGFALGEQMIPSKYRLPVDAWDWKVDAVVLGHGALLRA